jgi:pimeloyl-ACP methyl ester carboxylesterase
MSTGPASQPASASQPGPASYAGNASYPGSAHYRLERREGPLAVVLLHGLGGDLDHLWGLTGGAIGGRPASLLAADARAHGQTSLLGPHPLTFELLAEDVLGLVDELGIGPRLVLVGVSMGAATALALALAAPERVHGLVLLRPAWEHEPLPPNLAPMAEIASLLRRAGAQEGRSLFGSSETYARVAAISPSTADSLLSQFDKTAAVARVRRLEDLPRSVPYAAPAALRTVTAPTLVVGTPGDPLHPLDMAERLHQLLPAAQLRVVTSRDVSAERYEAGTKASVNDFLRTLPSIDDVMSPAADVGHPTHAGEN